MTTLQRRRERGDMIQTRRILNGKDRVDPAKWFRLQEDQTREGAISIRINQGYQALLPRPPFRVVDMYKSMPNNVKMAISTLGGREGEKWPDLATEVGKKQETSKWSEDHIQTSMLCCSSGPLEY